MANTSFRLARIAVVVDPGEPTLAAWPTVFAAPYVQFPKPTRSNGYNQPAGIVGLPFCVLGREKISSTGLAFYNGIFTSATAEYVRVKAQLYNPRAQAWKVYAGTMWRPEFKESAAGLAYGFREFRITIIDLTELAGWSTVAS